MYFEDSYSVCSFSAHTAPVKAPYKLPPPPVRSMMEARIFATACAGLQRVKNKTVGLQYVWGQHPVDHSNKFIIIAVKDEKMSK